MRIRTALTSLATAGALAAGVLIAGAAGDDSTPTARAATTKTVKFGEYFYKPKTITVSVGDAVRFVNVGKIEHTVADSTKSATIRGKIIRPRPLSHGRSQTVRFRTRGSVRYLCTFHPDLMRGVVVVR
jgi:plastocyanin